MDRTNIKLVIGLTHNHKPTVLYIGRSLQAAEFAESVALQSNAYYRVNLYINPTPVSVYERTES
jgi:hypothetical protein